MEIDNNENDENIVVTMRCIDIAPVIDKIDKRSCSECGEMTWISASFRGKKIDKVICDKCYFKKYHKEDNDIYVTEECIKEAEDHIKDYDNKITKEEIIKVVENKIGSKIRFKKL